MVSIRVFSMILATLLCRELMWDGGATTIVQSAVAILGYWLIFGAVSKFAALYVAVPNAEVWLDEQPHPLERFSTYRRLIEVVWVMLLPVAFLITAWGPTLKSAESVGMFPSVSLVLWFLPTLLLLLALEWNHVQLEIYLESLAPAADPRIISPPARSLSVCSFCKRLMMRLRLGELGGCVICVTPVFMVSAFTDLAGWYMPSLSIESKALIGLAVMVVAALVTAPCWMSLWMGAKKFPIGPAGHRITELCRLAGCGNLKLKLIGSQNTWCGAAVVGWHSLDRQLWVGDGLMAKLSPLELDIVVLHEVAHVVRRHFFWRIVPILIAITLGVVVHELTTLLIAVMSADHFLARWLETSGTAIGLIVGLLTTIVGLGWYARRCELEADRYACYLAAKHCLWSAGRPTRAATVMISALENLLGDHDSAAQPSWLHPGLIERLENMYELIRLDLESQRASNSAGSRQTYDASLIEA